MEKPALLRLAFELYVMSLSFGSGCIVQLYVKPLLLRASRMQLQLSRACANYNVMMFFLAPTDVTKECIIPSDSIVAIGMHLLLADPEEVHTKSSSDSVPLFLRCRVQTGALLFFLLYVLA